MADCYSEAEHGTAEGRKAIQSISDAGRRVRAAACAMVLVHPHCTGTFPDFELLDDPSDSRDRDRETRDEVAGLGEAAILQASAFAALDPGGISNVLSAKVAIDRLREWHLIDQDVSVFDLAASYVFFSEKDAARTVSAFVGHFRPRATNDQLRDTPLDNEEIQGYGWAIEDWCVRKIYGAWSPAWRERRQALGLPYREVAKAAGLSGPTYLSAEKGELAVRGGTARAIEDALERLEDMVSAAAAES